MLLRLATYGVFARRGRFADDCFADDGVLAGCGLAARLGSVGSSRGGGSSSRNRW